MDSEDPNCADRDSFDQTTESCITEEVRPTENNKVCIICSSSEDDSLKTFGDKTWGAMKRAAELRVLLKSDCYITTTLEVNQLQNAGDAMYHSRCYRLYTAVKRPSKDSQSMSPANTPKTRRSSAMPASDEKGLLKGTCIFCPVVRKTVNRKVEPLSDCLTQDGCDSILAAAPRSSNERLKALINSGVDLIAKEAQYHKTCRREFFREIENSSPKDKCSSNRRLHSSTFETISNLIETEVIANHQAILCSSIWEFYRTEYLSNGSATEDIENYRLQPLLQKIRDKFSDRITVSLFDQRKGNFVYSSSMSNPEARESLLKDDEKHLNLIRSAALHLRGVILAMPKSETPSPTSVETLKTCSPELPEEILVFYKTLLCGLREPSCADNNKETVNRKVIGMSSDAVYNVSRGTVRPWKHTLLGLGLGTLTGSKLILRMLNRLGHSLSYDEVKALETEFAFSMVANDRDAPDGIKLNPDQGTGLAWDNYDVNMETIDGKDTIRCPQSSLMPVNYLSSTCKNMMIILRKQ